MLLCLKATKAHHILKANINWFPFFPIPSSLPSYCHVQCRGLGRITSFVCWIHLAWHVQYQMLFVLFSRDWINRVVGHSLSRGAATWGSKVHVYLSDSDIKLLWDGSSDCFSLNVNSAVDQRLNAISTFSFTSLDYTTFGFGYFYSTCLFKWLGTCMH